MSGLPLNFRIVGGQGTHHDVSLDISGVATLEEIAEIHCVVAKIYDGMPVADALEHIEKMRSESPSPA